MLLLARANSLECATLSALWSRVRSAQRCVMYVLLCLMKPLGYQAATESQLAKASTTGVPGAAAALGWRGGALQGVERGAGPNVRFAVHVVEFAG